MSGVETLRDAAEWMRKRAERATDGPWGFSSRWTTPNTMLTRILKADGVIAEARGNGNELYDLEYLSHMDPTVALAIADWLDAEADRESPLWETAVTFDGTPMFSLSPQALAVAHAYLRTTP